MGGEDPRRRRVRKTPLRVKQMKSRALFLLSVLCAAVSFAGAPDYGKKENWLICEADKDPNDREVFHFDVFYLPPTLAFDPRTPYVDFARKPRLRKRFTEFSQVQIRCFAPRARVFVPCVRQLEYYRAAVVVGATNDWRRSRELVPGVNDTVRAFRHYLAHFNRGRPYIIFGHSQGAMDLYLMMCRMPELSVERGFVAAYLIGLPRLTANEIAADLAPRGIRPAARADDLGVIIGWNTRRPEANDFVFTSRGTYCINPLNWRTDATTAGAKAHRGAFQYDNVGKRVRFVKNLSGAKIDSRSGALLFSPPKDQRWEYNRSVSASGILHMEDVWFFTENLRLNIEMRVKKWCEKYGR